MRRLTLIPLLAALLLPAAAAAGSKIKEVKKALRKSSSSSTSGGDAGDIAEAIYIFIYYFDYCIFSDNGFRYPPHPYFEGHNGYITAPPEEAGFPPAARPFAFSAVFSYTSVDANTYGLRATARLRLPAGSSFFVSYTRFEEYVPHQGYDHFNFMNVLHRIDLIGLPQCELVLDVGVASFPGLQTAGLSIGIGLEAFPGSPITASVVFRGHAMENDCSVSEAEISLGVVRGCVEALIGYREFYFRYYDSFGSRKTVDLSGPSLMLRLWL